MKLKSIIKKIIHNEKKVEWIAVPETINSNKLLEGKSALIMGGSSGIGLSMAKEFTKHGCNVVIAGRDEKKIEKAVDSCDRSIQGVVIDLSKCELFENKINETAKIFQNSKIDILVNCAGVRSEGTFGSCRENEFDQVLSTNVKGVYFMCQSMGKYMIENNIKGHILNVSSSSALRPAQTPYQISKWAIKGMTMGIAEALFPYGIVVNAIAPGPTTTPMLGISENENIRQPTFQFGRYELPREIAQLAVFMVSPLGNVVVGDTLYATGGSGVLSLHR